MDIRAHTGRFIRYGMLGVVSNALGYLLFLAVVRLPTSPEAASGITYIIVLAANYFFSRRLVFQSDGRHTTDLPKYAFAYGVGFVVTIGAMSVLSATMDPDLAQLLVIVLSAVSIYSTLVLVRFGLRKNNDAD